MQWGLIFGHESVFGGFSGLTESEKILIGVAYLYRQKRLIQVFDSTYNKDLSKYFDEGVIECMRKDGQVDAMRLSLEGIIPDTEEFPEQEGAYAQNLLIALTYFLLFSKSNEPKLFEDSMAMALENIDLINYEADEAYNYELMLEDERKVASLMIDRLKNFHQKQANLKLVSQICIDFNV